MRKQVFIIIFIVLFSLISYAQIPSIPNPSIDYNAIRPKFKQPAYHGLSGKMLGAIQNSQTSSKHDKRVGYLYRMFGDQEVPLKGIKISIINIKNEKEIVSINTNMEGEFYLPEKDIVEGISYQALINSKGYQCKQNIEIPKESEDFQNIKIKCNKNKRAAASKD